MGKGKIFLYFTLLIFSPYLRGDHGDDEKDEWCDSNRTSAHMGKEENRIYRIGVSVILKNQSMSAIHNLCGLYYQQEDDHNDCVQWATDYAMMYYVRCKYKEDQKNHFPTPFSQHNMGPCSGGCLKP